MKALSLALIFFTTIIKAQNIFLTEVKTTHANRDKFLYAAEQTELSQAVYLGKIEVSGYSAEDEVIFNEIYKKAKLIGANAYYISGAEGIEGPRKFTPSHYFLHLYYASSNTFPKEDNWVYFINSGKDKTIRINQEKVTLPYRSYIKYNLNLKNQTEVAVGNFLGSRMKLQPKDGQSEQYFQLSGNKISTDHSNPGIKFKTGDFIRLEKSYAQFLIKIYQKN